MLNCFRLYAITWTLVIVLYDLRWSDYCTPLNVWLRLFIYFSIFIGFWFGKIYSSTLRFKKLDKPLNITNTGTIVIISAQMMEYLYCRQIPILYVISQQGGYTDFEGIPTLHVFIYTFATFYAQYLFYAYLNDKDKRYLFNYFAIVICVYGLQFMRGGLVICLAMSFLLWLSSVKITFKKGFSAALIIVLAMYIFGGAGNVRSGASWNDSSAFFRFGGINDKYPSWLPSQFAWTYSYVVGCLATLNYNIGLSYSSPNVGHFFQAIIPDFLMRRIWPDEELDSAQLIWRGFTTRTGYFEAYHYGGIFGIYAMFILLLVLAAFITQSSIIKPQFRMIALANLSIILPLYFFTNAIAVSAIGFILFYPVFLSVIMFKQKYRFGQNEVELYRWFRIKNNASRIKVKHLFSFKIRTVFRIKR